MKPFNPLFLPIKEKIDQLYFVNELVAASTNIGKYQMILKNSKVNKDFLIEPITRKEALQSSKIEGTQATLDEVLQVEVYEKVKSNDVQEVLNYYKAIKTGERLLQTIPICSRMFKELHRVLLSHGVRGQNRVPGEFRKIQNFIGAPNCTIETASYVSPEPHLVDKYMSNLDKYINEPDDNFHPLIRIAIIHAQFEAIHPFLDGNGRIGRILIPLYLFQAGILEAPNFFISDVLEQDKHKYYRLLNETRFKENWNEWIKFFLTSANKQAVKSIKLVEDINLLYERDLKTAIEVVSNTNVIKIVDVMFKQPIFNVKNISSLTGIPDVTCRRYLNQLEDAHLIFSNDKKRGKTYFYYNLLDLIR